MSRPEIPEPIKPQTAVSRVTQQLFHVLDIYGRGSVSSTYFIGFLNRCGLQRNDIRLKELFSIIEELLQEETDDAQDHELSLQEFDQAISNCRTLIHKAVTDGFKVSSFEDHIVKNVTTIYEKIKHTNGGDVASYIPELANIDPDHFAISLTTVDGQQFNIGDSNVPFSVQSCSKPLSYIMALEQFGAEYVHKCIGTEPSGQSFNEVKLKDAPTPDNPKRQIPHNPMINAGAMVATSMMYPDLDSKERLEKAMNCWRDASQMGEEVAIGFDQAVYESESKTGDRNWCLAYMMKEKRSFPPCFDYQNAAALKETVEYYFQNCSITSTTNATSVMAATLANGGQNPCTGKRVFEPISIRKMLPIMFTSGMYDYSGQWAYDIGVPAKSGVSGAVFVVIPNVCGICIWSPRLDTIGNSVRGVQVAFEMVNIFSFHNFEVFSGINDNKIDITKRSNASRLHKMSEILFAAHEGDLPGITAEIQGIDWEADDAINSMIDYDSRTPFHLAASEGHEEVLQYLIQVCPRELMNMKDRWGGTALYYCSQFPECEQMLIEAGCVREAPFSPPSDESESSTVASTEDGYTQDVTVSYDAPLVIFFAGQGDMDELVKLAALGADFMTGDYDGRTALHLAASNNHPTVIRYLCTRMELWALKSKDRMGNTALDDAVREGHNECESLLRMFEMPTPQRPRLEMPRSMVKGGLLAKSANVRRTFTRTIFEYRRKVGTMSQSIRASVTPMTIATSRECEDRCEREDPFCIGGRD